MIISIDMYRNYIYFPPIIGGQQLIKRFKHGYGISDYHKWNCLFERVQKVSDQDQIDYKSSGKFKCDRANVYGEKKENDSTWEVLTC